MILSCDDYVYVPVSNTYALIDAKDLEEVSRYRWYLSSHGYAFNQKNNVYMHRLIMKNPIGLQIDHINFNKLDNRKSNLRAVTSRYNSLHRPINKNNKSGYKGITFRKSTGKYEAFIWERRKKIHLGYFKDIDEAIKIRQKAEKTHGY